MTSDTAQQIGQIWANQVTAATDAEKAWIAERVATRFDRIMSSEGGTQKAKIYLDYVNTLNNMGGELAQLTPGTAAYETLAEAMTKYQQQNSDKLSRLMSGEEDLYDYYNMNQTNVTRAAFNAQMAGATSTTDATTTTDTTTNTDTTADTTTTATTTAADENPLMNPLLVVLAVVGVVGFLMLRRRIY